MESHFRKSEPDQIKDNIFKLIGSDWMLITAGALSDYNTMTASWGGMGVLWNKLVCFCFVRPQRYTYKFMEQRSYFTLSFFNEQFRDALLLCGTKSGRDIDKAKVAGLTPLAGTNETVFFSEARLILTCKKIYFSDIQPTTMLDPGILKNYPDNDFHRMYIGEIIEVLEKGE